jgi:DNA-binding NtrC family response regulator
MTHILLVDDDPFQASLMLSLLGRRFGEVRRVRDAAEALCLIEQPEIMGDLRLVISGQLTTGIGGPAFVSELSNRMPEMPILVLGTARETRDDYAEDQVCFMTKPFSAEFLLDRIRQILATHIKAVA